MADRPIIFSGPMVRALLDGRKTQTRRVINPQPESGVRFQGFERDGQALFTKGPFYAKQRIPYAPGDRLYVREAHALVPSSAYRMSPGVPYAVNDADPDQACVYREGWERSKPGKWRPSIHMPRWASRLTLTVTEVRVQRLQEISEADAVAEGIEGDGSGAWLCYAPEPKSQTHWADPRASYRTLWDSLHGPDAWDANPWVVAPTFTVRHGNIDQVAHA